MPSSSQVPPTTPADPPLHPHPSSTNPNLFMVDLPTHSSAANQTDHAIDPHAPSDRSVNPSTVVPPVGAIEISSIPKMSSRPPVKGWRVITTKVSRRKLPPNLPVAPINGVSFHSEYSMHKWKYVVQRRMANEMNILDKHQSCTP